MKIFLSALLSFFFTMSFGQSKQYMLVGTYTNGKSIGIYVYQFNNGRAMIVDSVKTSNPSYLAVSPHKDFVYAVNEDAEPGVGGKVSAFSFDALSGKLKLINQQKSYGDHPCYISVDKTGKWVMVGNYSSGSVAVLPVEKNGSLGEAVSTITHQGSSINKQRQQSAHVHATVVSPDNHAVLVPDLGIDKMMVYPFDPSTGKLDSAKLIAVNLEKGSGPRHVEFHPNGKWIYLVQELSGTITAFRYSKKTIAKVQTISTLPKAFNQSFTSADIHVSPDGKFLYASNRDSSNTIAIFKINMASGRLELLGHQATLGKTPRNFNFDPSGDFLLVANQRSDEIVIYSRNKTTGLLTDTGNRVEVASPVCIKWIF
ncbi:MAG TPA: lactonase family protein [Flavisolibacter sp.]|nr:lactonase family protein [Flavisolibacter sp.]